MKQPFFDRFFQKYLTGSRAKARFSFLFTSLLFAALSLVMTVVNLLSLHGISLVLPSFSERSAGSIFIWFFAKPKRENSSQSCSFVWRSRLF